MKFVKPILSVGLISIMLMGCANNANNNDGFTNNEDNRPMGVRYNPNNNNNDDWDGRADRFGNNNREGFGTNVTNRNNGANNNNNNLAQQLDIADDVADKVAQMKEVDRASVIVTNRNAYVAVKLNNNGGNKLNNEVERKIADKVRDVYNNIDNVYVSENPDFYDRMTGWVNDIRNGQPVSGFFNEFYTTVQRMWPTAR